MRRRLFVSYARGERIRHNAAPSTSSFEVKQTTPTMLFDVRYALCTLETIPSETGTRQRSEPMMNYTKQTSKVDSGCNGTTNVAGKSDG